MKEIKTWKPGLTPEEERDIAYWERNMLALHMAACYEFSGWYKHEEYPGWGRVISIWNGSLTFHVPDEFDLMDLPEINKNWDGHSTEEKWRKVKSDIEECIDEKYQGGD